MKDGFFRKKQNKKQNRRVALFYACKSLHRLAPEEVAGSSYLFPMQSLAVLHIM